MKYEYKVVVFESDQTWEAIEGAMNDLGLEGWRAIQVLEDEPQIIAWLMRVGLCKHGKAENCLACVMESYPKSESGIEECRHGITRRSCDICRG